MIVFRLVRKKYGFALTGEGAKISGGRWNSVDLPVIYTSDSRALCTAEVAVTLQRGILPNDFEMLSISIPDNILIHEIRTVDLPEGWRKFPYLEVTMQIGNRFILENRFMVMKVPSAVVPGDFNYLINPRHPDFEKIRIISTEPYEFDERFFSQR
ncbi:MAG TPA: RES family NAD+ phosphorylase [Bacteroidales bacterium]|nr:RES family NAD+ phosphorylase [Bacteroidales bacterium]HPI86241.1 RES family NAD+ phosphorylase [Bacteroidales bacterium]HPM93049.1 RES family NAD+ phosphorylase [Bacteroidales bacterium]